MTDETITITRKPSPVPRLVPSPVPRDKPVPEAPAGEPPTDAPTEEPVAQPVAAAHAEEPAAEEPVAQRRLLRRIPLAAVIIAALAVAAVAAVVVLYQRQDTAAHVETARTQALAAARQHVPEVLSYNADTLDKDLDTALRATTGPFHGELADLQRTVIRPSATTDKITTQTTVSDAGVVRADEREAVVLVFLNQLTTSRQQTTPRIDGARVRVTLQQADGGWLISALEPV